MQRAWCAVVVMVVALAGCSKILGFKELTFIDGGIDGSPDAGTLVAPPNTVVGRIYTKCHQASGDVESPTDLSQAIIQALIFDDGERAYRTVEGVGRSDGTFRIDGVPDGVTYIFRFATAYYVTDQHVIDDHLEIARRCVPAPAVQTTPTPITWNVTGMTPFHIGLDYIDELEVSSLALGYHSTVLNALTFDDTVFDAVTDWSTGTLTFVVTPLVDATAGDDLFVFHVRREALSNSTFGRKHSASRLIDWARPTGVTLHDGVATSISGAFQPVAANRTISFSVDRAVFDAGHSGASRPSSLAAWIVATPAPDDSQGGEVLATFDLGDVSRGGSLRQDVASYRYGDPFPDSWRRYSIVQYGRDRAYKHPGASFATRLSVFSRQLADYTTAINASQPLQPPGGAKIGGVAFDLGGKVAFDGTSPVEVEWNPVLSAKSYRLAVSRVTASGRQLVASIRTAGTSLALPAELFGAGQFYVFVLAAVRTPNDYQGGQILPSGLPNQIAELASGLFRLSAECGDGAVKSGEESCDARGETAACDVDCTLPECGDGLRNALAGEACDAAGIDTPGCDADCTVPTCGDGHRNDAVEDCDDGNAVDDGNGCGRDCKLNNVCGNDRVESIAEECDPGFGGETATCDADCTRARCGDERVNAAAGEECDHGLANGSGNCTTACKLQP
jgi:hypothetical protein